MVNFCTMNQTSPFPESAPDFTDPLGLLRACHQRMLDHCERLLRLADHLQDHGADSDAQQAAAATARTWTHEELMTEGEKVYARACAACHQPSGAGMPPVFPSLIKSPITTGDINAHIEIVLHGKPGTAMQAFGNQLTPAEVAAVVTWERNAWGNDTGDTVTPADVQQHIEQ